VEKMKAEAKANEATDKAEKEKVEKLNMADSLVFQTEKQLKEYGEKIPAEKKTAIEQAAEKLKEAHKAQDLTGIDTAMAALNAAWTAASEDMYKTTQEQPGQGTSEQGTSHQGTSEQGSNGQRAADNVTDVPYEEVK
jgi:molecular chaperone DnaK